MVRITRTGRGHNISYTTLIIATLLFAIAFMMFVFTGDKSSITISGTVAPTWLMMAFLSIVLIIYDLIK